LKNENKLKQIKSYIDEIGVMNVGDLKRKFHLSSGELELILLILGELNIKKIDYSIVKCSNCDGCKLKTFCSFKGGMKHERSNEKISGVVEKV